jgi:hypothetical protein
MRLSALLVAVFVLNIVCLELGFVAMTRGVPWWLVDELWLAWPTSVFTHSSCARAPETGRKSLLLGSVADVRRVTKHTRLRPSRLSVQIPAP